MMRSQHEATTDHIRIMVRIRIRIELSLRNIGRIPIKPYVTARIVTILLEFIILFSSHQALGAKSQGY